MSGLLRETLLFLKGDPDAMTADELRAHIEAELRAGQEPDTEYWERRIYEMRDTHGKIVASYEERIKALMEPIVRAKMLPSPPVPPVGVILEPSRVVAWMGLGVLSHEPVFAGPDEPRSNACGPWQPLCLASERDALRVHLDKATERAIDANVAWAKSKREQDAMATELAKAREELKISNDATLGHATGFREGIEAAAKVCDEMCYQQKSVKRDYPVGHGANLCANAIRALQPAEPAKDPLASLSRQLREAEAKLMPQPCCGEWATCTRACTPRGEHKAEARAEQILAEWVAAEDARLILVARVRPHDFNRGQTSDPDPAWDAAIVRLRAAEADARAWLEGRNG